MKKIIIILFIISIIFIVSNKNEIMIPKDSIRFRILANSNSIEDQALKNKVKDEIINDVISKYEFNENSNSKEIIEKSIPDIESIVKKYDVNYTINFGKNYFPEKEYNGIKYPEGDYESLVITIDKGKGDNFWCVLYPPLCLVEDNKDYSNIEYKSIIKHIINKYIKHI